VEELKDEVMKGLFNDDPMGCDFSAGNVCKASNR
jgi:hypothetical protein